MEAYTCCAASSQFHLATDHDSEDLYATIVPAMLSMLPTTKSTQLTCFWPEQQ